MRTGIYMFLIWGVPAVTTGILVWLAYSRRTSPERLTDQG